MNPSTKRVWDNDIAILEAACRDIPDTPEARLRFVQFMKRWTSRLETFYLPRRPRGGKFKGLKTTGQWLEFVDVLGRILARDDNVHSQSPDLKQAVAQVVPAYMQAKPYQVAEAKSLVGKPMMEIEEHFMFRTARRR